jgi:hypothetical protein
MTTTTHLLGVWNPSYAADAMDLHLAVLLEWARRRAEKKAEEDDVYVWWGKVKSQNRQQPLPHVREILAIDEQIQAGTETHLYLTDYRSLYVAHLGEITADDVRADGEADHVPPYYAAAGYLTDFWFRLFDIRRLVADDTVAVVEELKKLRNTRYNDRSVSLYGGIYQLPLLVTSNDDTQWFADRDSLIGPTLWAERDGYERGGTERLAADLRDNLIGRATWAKLQIGTRNFLASGELVYRRHRDDAQFDFSTAVVEYAKAIEVEVNQILRPGLIQVSDGARHLSLGDIAHLLDAPPPLLGTWLNAKFGAKKSWWTGEFAMRLGILARSRNPAAHGELVSRELASSLREEIVGIGQEGLIVKLASFMNDSPRRA